MADVTPARKNIALPGTQFLGAVSEFIAQTLAGAANFINYFQHSEKQFFLNGVYNVGQSLPQTGVDGMAVFEFDAQIIDVWMFNLVAGSSGSTELDIQLANTSGGSFASIFSTKPSIAAAAGNNAWVGGPISSIIGPNFTYPSYTTPSNTVSPVLNRAITDVIPAFSAIRCDLTSVQGGAPENCGILVHYRPV